jgi:CPA2 family monovalent cation:H+ antiporter-2
MAELNLRTRFGCSIVGIERQGFMIPLPTADTVLYPRDRVLLLGTLDQVAAGRAFLGAVSGNADADSLFEEVRMDSMNVPAWSRGRGLSLAEIPAAHRHGVQIAGILRGGARILIPGAQEKLYESDELLVLGTAEQTGEFRAWLVSNPAEEE